MEAHVLSLNEFNMPTVYKDRTGDALHIVYLLLLDKGKFQSHPDMGVGLRTRFRWTSGESILYDVRAELIKQLETYLPEVSISDIRLTLTDDYVLGIYIATGDNAEDFLMAYDTKNDEIKIGPDAAHIINSY